MCRAHKNTGQIHSYLISTLATIYQKYVAAGQLKRKYFIWLGSRRRRISHKSRIFTRAHAHVMCI
jgi:hypothetical protein